MECPRIVIHPEAVRGILSILINEFIRIEKSENGLAYQQQSNSVRGKNYFNDFFS